MIHSVSLETFPHEKWVPTIPILGPKFSSPSAVPGTIPPSLRGRHQDVLCTYYVPGTTWVRAQVADSEESGVLVGWRGSRGVGCGPGGSAHSGPAFLGVTPQPSAHAHSRRLQSSARRAPPRPSPAPGSCGGSSRPAGLDAFWESSSTRSKMAASRRLMKVNPFSGAGGAGERRPGPSAPRGGGRGSSRVG